MSGDPQGQRVLVVDDDPAIVELITTRLDLAGYRTFSARNGHQGISRITEVLPAVLVLDINMPGLDGFEVLKRLGRSGHLSRLPTMVLTARNRPEDVQRAIKLGARDYMAKPFNDQQFLMRIARLLRPRRMGPSPPMADQAEDGSAADGRVAL